MMTTRKKTLLILFVFSLILTGCTGRTTLKRGWVETGGLSHLNVRYHYFDGIERRTFRARAGADIHLQAELDVDEGTLAVRLLDPTNELIWENTYQEDDRFSLSVEAEDRGRYKLLVEGENAEGGFEVNWKVKD